MTQHIDEFLRRLSADGIECATDEKSLFAASLDHMRYSFPPQVVVFAKSASEVSKTLRNANELDVPVTVRGSGTGCTGGCVPICGGVVLDVSKIDFIEIDPVARLAHVGAGAITANVDAKAGKYGFFYAPDPSSHKFSSIGGNIACNAGGLRALKYGNTRENVLSLKAVLVDGTEITGALPLKKYSFGLNLRDLFIGSEGTLGVVVEAWLKLLPKPESKTTALAFFDGDKKAFEGIEMIMESNLSPCILEFLDVETVSCIRARNPNMDIPQDTAAILAEFDDENNAEQAAKFTEILSSIADAKFAKTSAEAEELWKVRRAASQSMYELGDSKLSQDVVLPHTALDEFFAYYKRLGRETKLATPIFGHAGDGNYHIHFMYNSADPTARARAVDAMDSAIKKAVELGGAVSGEHGVGFLKSKYMPLQHTQAELEIMRSIKKLFDPKNILNREKVYIPHEIKNLTPLKNIKLPWD